MTFVSEILLKKCLSSEAGDYLETSCWTRGATVIQFSKRPPIEYSVVIQVECKLCGTVREHRAQSTMHIIWN